MKKIMLLMTVLLSLVACNKKTDTSYFVGNWMPPAEVYKEYVEKGYFSPGAIFKIETAKDAGDGFYYIINLMDANEPAYPIATQAKQLAKVDANNQYVLRVTDSPSEYGTSLYLTYDPQSKNLISNHTKDASKQYVHMRDIDLKSASDYTPEERKLFIRSSKRSSQDKFFNGNI